MCLPIDGQTRLIKTTINFTTCDWKEIYNLVKAAVIVWEVIIANVEVAYHVNIYVLAYGDCIKKVQLAGLYLINCIQNIHDDNAWYFLAY